MAVVEQRVMAPDDLPAEVEGFLGAPDDWADEPTPPAVDPALAPRIARRRARIAQRLAERRAAVAAEIRRLTEWADFQDARDEVEAERLDLILGNILAAERARDPRKKTLTLPYGVTVKARAQQPEWVRNDEILLPWLESSAPEFVKVEREPNWRELKDELIVAPDGRVLLGGEPVPGITAQTRPEKIEVKVSTEGTDA